MRGEIPGDPDAVYIPGAAPCFCQLPGSVMLFICGILGIKQAHNQKNAVQRIAVRRRAVEKGPFGPFFA